MPSPTGRPTWLVLLVGILVSAPTVAIQADPGAATSAATCAAGTDTAADGTCEADTDADVGDPARTPATSPGEEGSDTSPCEDATCREDAPSTDATGSSTGEDVDDMEALRLASRAILRQGVEAWYEDLSELRAQYHEGTEAMREAYRAERADLRQTYLACMADARETLDREAAWSCRDRAKGDLAALNAHWRGEHQALRAGLVEEAEERRQGLCDSLEASLVTLLVEHQATLVGLDEGGPALSQLDLCEGWHP
ncbi:MAG: hypothetical protein R3185_00915 [Candidatus Thermoplasmatota archaeon]|nr:hypothetical protein [Candidatus Thermoplasmatota archaeon]